MNVCVVCVVVMQPIERGISSQDKELYLRNLSSKDDNKRLEREKGKGRDGGVRTDVLQDTQTAWVQPTVCIRPFVLILFGGCFFQHTTTDNRQPTTQKQQRVGSWYMYTYTRKYEIDGTKQNIRSKQAPN